MPRVKKDGWVEVTTEQAVIIRGGLIPRTKDIVLPTKNIQTFSNGSLTNEIFVKLSKAEKWIWTAIGGTHRDILFNTTFMSHVEKALKALGNVHPLEDSSGDSPPVDLMAGIEEVQPSMRRGQTRRQRYSSIRCKDQISIVSVPVKPKSDEMREIRVYAESTRKLFISLSDIDWVLTFAKEEDATKYGLNLDNDHSEDDDEDACKKARVTIHFCFRRYAWIASNAADKVEMFVLAPRRMDAEQWKQAAHLHKYSCDFEEATSEQLHEACRYYVVWRMRLTGASPQE